MTRVIVHAGFHKCGTTSLQDFLKSNQAALRPYFDYYGKVDFLAAGANARRYSQRPFIWRLWRFRRSFRRFLNTIEAAETIVLSRETFSGGMPGHRRIGGGLMQNYSRAATALGPVILSELYRRFGADTEVIFAYSTREMEGWIKSIHGHLLRSIRLRDDFDTFRKRFTALRSPAAQATLMADFLAPVKVLTLPLEVFTSHREGPAAGLLDYLEIPQAVRAGLKPARRANSGQNRATRAQFLALNRDISNKVKLKQAKTELQNRLEAHHG
ncbi:MAG: hypothetical protein GXP03_03810 [Alphaproteobacteria bacterium]|nr:hypothetical protein [Alphaproteobacteria bacterium]